MDKVYWIRLYSLSVPLGPITPLLAQSTEAGADLEMKVTGLGSWAYPHTNARGP